MLINPRVVLLTLLALAVLGGLGTWWWRTHERVEKWIDLPRTGEAATNPLYVLKLALQKDGVAVQARRRLQRDQVALAARDTVLLYNDPRTLLSDEVRDAAGLGAQRRPSDRAHAATGAAGESTQVPLLSELQVVPMADATGQTDCVADAGGRARTPHVEFCDGRRFTVGAQGAAMPEQPARRVASDDGYVFARIARGRGIVDVLADLDFLTNDSSRTCRTSR